MENPSHYIAYQGVEMDEGEFLTTLASTGLPDLVRREQYLCRARSLGRDPLGELMRFPPGRRRIHVARPLAEEEGASSSTYDRPACDEVLALFATAKKRFGGLPALFEWDSELPDLEVLLAEARRVEDYREDIHDHA